jgi:hypothetical protein
MGRLSQYYGKLPVIRELRRIHQALLEIEGQLARQTAEGLDGYVSNLLSADRYQNPKKLNRHEFQVYSQNGEDGVIAEIFRRIGTGSRHFVEIGVGDGLENNTTFLLSQGWSGDWIEADAGAVRAIDNNLGSLVADRRLKVKHSFVTAENVCELFEEMGVPHEFDLLSLDIDRNTYFIWKALEAYQPKVVVVEYNASFPPDVDWKVEYEPHRTWNQTMYFGASLKALELLGEHLGYALVGCELNGVNAFFIRKDLCSDKFAAPFTSENHFEPARHWLIRRAGHPRCFSDFV